jgi:alginate O-acetyltransferase complex protein AlgJ
MAMERVAQAGLSRRVRILPALNLMAKLALPMAVVAFGLNTVLGVGEQMLRVGSFDRLSGMNWADGSGPRTFDETFANLDYRQSLSRDIAGALRFRLLGETRKGVVVGKDGWLFNLDDFVIPADIESAAGPGLDIIESSAAAMSAKGSRLVVALLPLKIEMAQEHLDHPVAVSRAREARELVVDRLRTAGVEVVDTFPGAMMAREAGEVAFRTDQHWTVLGSGAAARSIADAVGVFGEARFELRPDQTQSFFGDLSGAVGTPRAAEMAGVAAEHVSPLILTSHLGPPDGRVALVGTSASADPRWSFALQLGAALGVDILNLATSATGPFYPMLTAMKDWEAAGTVPELVVWEVTLASFFKPEHLQANGAARMLWLD